MDIIKYHDGKPCSSGKRKPAKKKKRRRRSK